ncbi:MAG: hypothetical protein ACMUJM_16020 [bacterium]
MKRLLLLCLIGFFLFGCASAIGLVNCHREVDIDGVKMWDCERRLICNGEWKYGCPCPPGQEPCLTK